MRVPLIDAIIDRKFESKPRKIKMKIRSKIVIPAGERRGAVEIPCSLYASNMAIMFPDGFRYVVGEEHREGEKGERARFKTCPEIMVELPDIADVPITIPVEFGLGHSIERTAKDEIACGLFFVGIGVLALIVVGITPFMLGSAALLGFFGLIEIRRAMRTLAWLKGVEVEEVK